MKFKSVATAVALAAAACAAHATSSLTMVVSNFSISSPGFMRLTSVGGGFTVSAQDQIGWTAGGLTDWGPLQTNTATFAAPGASITSANGAHAEVLKTQSFSVSTPAQGGFALAEQDYTLSFLLGAHATVTVSWDIALSGSNSGHSAGLFSAMGTVNLGDQTKLFPFSLAFDGTDGSASAFASSPDHRSISFTNNSDATILTSYHSDARISTRDEVPAVPEPEVAWLALAGLALAGAQVRRRKA